MCSLWWCVGLVDIAVLPMGLQTPSAPSVFSLTPPLGIPHSVQWLAVSIWLSIYKVLPGPLRRQLNQAPFSKPSLASTIVSAFGDWYSMNPHMMAFYFKVQMLSQSSSNNMISSITTLFCGLVPSTFAVIKFHNQKLLGEESIYFRCMCQHHKETQDLWGRNWSRGHGGVLLTGLLFMVWSAWYLLVTRTTRTEVALKG